MKDSVKEYGANASIYNNLACLYATIDKKDKAYEYFMKAITLKEESGVYDKVLSNYYHNIAKLYEKDNNYDKAIFYYLKKVNVLEDISLSDKILVCYDNLIDLYKKNNDYDSVIKYYYKKIDILKNDIDYENILEIVNIYQEIIDIYRLNDKSDMIVNCYTEIISLLRSGCLNEEESKFILAHIYMMMGNYYKSIGNNKSAKKYFLKNIDIREEFRKKNYLFNNNLLMISYMNLLSLYYYDNDMDRAMLIRNKLNTLMNTNRVCLK